MPDLPETLTTAQSSDAVSFVGSYASSVSPCSSSSSGLPQLVSIPRASTKTHRTPSFAKIFRPTNIPHPPSRVPCLEKLARRSGSLDLPTGSGATR
jgi:hypothetical protein